MNANWSTLQTQFWSEGYVILDNFFPDEIIGSWKEKVLQNTVVAEIGVNVINKFYASDDPNSRDAAGSYNFISIDGRRSLNFPSLSEYYNSTANFLSLFTGLDIVTSFDKQSSVTFMFYPAPGGSLTAHYDTNQITFLIYLTDNDDGGTKLYPISALRPTILGQPDEIISEPVIILPRRGRILLFNGRRIWHQSLPVNLNYKISSVWNYYEKHDNWRPLEVSKRLYGN